MGWRGVAWGGVWHVACMWHVACGMCRAGAATLHTQVPAAFPKLFQHVHGLRFDEPPDYAYVQRTLAALAPPPPGAEPPPAAC